MTFIWSRPDVGINKIITNQEITDCKTALNSLRVKAGQPIISWSTLGLFISTSTFEEIRTKILDLEVSLTQTDGKLCYTFYATHKSNNLATHNTTNRATHYASNNSSTNTSVNSSHYSSHNGSNNSTLCSSHYSTHYSGYNSTLYTSKNTNVYTSYYSTQYITKYGTNDAGHYYLAKTSHDSNYDSYRCTGDK